MADKTTNLQLDKPTGKENFSRQMINGNMDKIDAAVIEKSTTAENNAKTHANTRVDAHAGIKASADALGHVEVDGTTINIDSNGKISTMPQDKGFNLDLARCYAENVVQVPVEGKSGFVEYATWATISDDTTNVKVGAAALRLTATAHAGNKYTDRNNVSLDFSKFPNREASSGDDFICIPVYISNAAIVNFIQLHLSNAATFPGTSFASVSKYSGLVTGWNFLLFKKSDFTISSGFTWNGIQSYELMWDCGAGNAGAYVTFDDFWLCRVDPVDSIKPNPFQHKENGVCVRDFVINSGFWFVGQEFGELVVKNINPNAAFGISLLSNKSYSDNFKATLFQKNSNLLYLAWYKDSDNFIEATVGGTALYLQKKEAGVLTSVNVSISVTSADNLMLTLSKSGTTIKAVAIRNGDYSIPYEVVEETALTGDGYLGIMTQNTTISIIKSISITTLEHSDHASRADWAASVGKGTWEVIQRIYLPADASQVDFLNISSEYKHFMLVYDAKNNSASNFRDLLIRTNGINGNYYYGQNAYYYANTSASGAFNAATSFALTKALPSTNNGVRGMGKIELANYDYSGYDGYSPTLMWDYTGHSGDAYGYLRGIGSGFVFSSGSIASISLIASGDSIKSGSRFILMGVK